MARINEMLMSLHSSQILNVATAVSTKSNHCVNHF